MKSKKKVRACSQQLPAKEGDKDLNSSPSCLDLHQAVERRKESIGFPAYTKSTENNKSSIFSSSSILGTMKDCYSPCMVEIVISRVVVQISHYFHLCSPKTRLLFFLVTVIFSP